MKTRNYLYPGNEMKYEAEIRCEEVAYDANFSYGIQIGNNFENRSKLMTSSFEDIENIKFPVSWLQTEVRG